MKRVEIDYEQQKQTGEACSGEADSANPSHAARGCESSIALMRDDDLGLIVNGKSDGTAAVEHDVTACRVADDRAGPSPALESGPPGPQLADVYVRQP